MYLVSSHHNKFTIRALQVMCNSVSDVEAFVQGGAPPHPSQQYLLRPKRLYQNVWLQDWSRQVKSWSSANMEEWIVQQFMMFTLVHNG